MHTTIHPFAAARRLLRRTRRSRDGSASIEYAILLPAVALLTLGTFETMMFLSVRTLIDAGTREASRFGLTGTQVDGMTREDRIRQIVAEKVSPLADPAAMTVQITAYNSFDQLEATPDPGVPGAGTGRQIVVYEVTYNQPVITPIFGKVTGVSHIPQHARVVVQNEPF